MYQSPEQFHCPACGDTTHVKKVSILVDEGTTHQTTTFFQPRVRRTLFQLHTFVGNTTSQTKLARKLAPPHSLLGVAVIVCLFCVFYGFFLASAGTFAGFAGASFIIGLSVLLLFYAISTWPEARKKKAKWEKLYYCDLHDLVFEVGKQEKAVPASNMNVLLKQDLFL